MYILQQIEWINFRTVEDTRSQTLQVDRILFIVHKCDIRNIYIMADRFPLMLTTANKEESKFNFKEVIVSALKSLIQIKYFNWYLSLTENVKIVFKLSIER